MGSRLSLTSFSRISQMRLPWFDTEAARRHFAEYLTGLIVAENKTVSGINREFALTTDQSCLNCWLTEVQWDVKALNEKRLAWLQQAPQTRYSVRGVIAIDNTLVTHKGKLIDDALQRGIPGDFTFDSYFTSAKILNHIQRQQAAYVGDLKLNRKVVYMGR